MLRLIAVVGLILMLSACATPALDMAGVNQTLTPDIAARQDQAARGQKVAWGGMVIHSRNLKDATEIEVLGYPLDRSGRPDRSAPAQHRFLILRDGYLETADYRNGRFVSAVGTLEGIYQGKVGDAPYVYPVLRAEQLYLRPIETERSEYGPRIGVGVGIILNR
jgi:outer membrane lipoprotein